MRFRGGIYNDSIDCEGENVPAAVKKRGVVCAEPASNVYRLFLHVPASGRATELQAYTYHFSQGIARSAKKRIAKRHAQSGWGKRGQRKRGRKGRRRGCFCVPDAGKVVHNARQMVHRRARRQAASPQKTVEGMNRWLAEKHDDAVGDRRPTPNTDNVTFSFTRPPADPLADSAGWPS